MRPRRYAARLKRDLRRRMRLREDCYSLAGISYDKDRVQQSHSTSRLEDQVVKLIGFDEAFRLDVFMLYSLMSDASKLICNNSQREIMEMYYIKLMEPEQIAQAKGCTKRWVNKCLVKGLEEMGKTQDVDKT